MAAFGSIQYTIGTALDRAREGGLLAEVLVEGHWLEGVVVANDGLGVVLANSAEEHCVVRLERVSAVRVRDGAPRVGIVGSAQANRSGESSDHGPRVATG